VAATVADHVVDHKGNAIAFWQGALQSLCASCHSGLKQRETRQATDVGYSLGVDASGEPTDARHPWHTGKLLKCHFKKRR
jgi:5-methylcytosine-specific restriction enzyme A